MTGVVERNGRAHLDPGERHRIARVESLEIMGAILLHLLVQCPHIVGHVIVVTCHEELRTAAESGFF